MYVSPTLSAGEEHDVGLAPLAYQGGGGRILSIETLLARIARCNIYCPKENSSESFSCYDYYFGLMYSTLRVDFSEHLDVIFCMFQSMNLRSINLRASNIDYFSKSMFRSVCFKIGSFLHVSKSMKLRASNRIIPPSDRPARCRSWPP